MSNVSPWLMLFVGLIIGWLLAWFFGRSGQKSLVERADKLESDLQKQATELSDCRRRSAELEGEIGAQVGALETELAAANAKTATLQEELATSRRTFEQQLTAAQAAAQPEATRTAVDLGAFVGATDPASEIDDFTQVKGIGPAFAARLAEAGITSYADLQTADPGELSNVLGIKEWQKVDIAAWQQQARSLADRPRKVQIGDDLTRLEGIGPTYALRLRAAGIVTFRQLADTEPETLDRIIGAPAWRKVNFGDWIDQARLAADGDEAGLKGLQDRLFSRKGDNLRLIEGVGDTGLEALENTGIKTYADLAAATPDQLRQMFSAAGLRAGNFDGWIAEAKLRAAGKRVKRTAPTRTHAIPAGILEQRSCPQDLEEIEGIGRIYEQRLYAAGIGTFWEVGMIADTELSAILDIREFQDVNLAAIKADALRLAQESDTMGHMWDGSVPDDFEILEGIGPVLERRLYSAGICTYEALAEATEALLERIAAAPAFQRPDYQRWIAQARERLAAAS